MTRFPIDWRQVVDEAVRRRKADNLTQRDLAALAGVSLPTVNQFEQGEINLRFERVVAILDAVGLFVQPGRSDSLGSFEHAARRRWKELIVDLPEDHTSRQPFGHSEQAYSLELGDDLPTLSKLRETLARAPGATGWPPFWVPTREALRPIIRDGVVECWLGKPDTDRVLTDAAHSDFWQIGRDGTAYLQRGYQEDGPDLQPGTIFDVALPIWRTGEVLLHAAWLARQFGAGPDHKIRFHARYTGLSGRELFSWAKPLLHIGLPEQYRARDDSVELKVTTTVGQVEADLQTPVGAALQPLYERFDGFTAPAGLIVGQIDDLLQEANRKNASRGRN
jgi:transcriptional regulator with XRE-family HTH domain